MMCRCYREKDKYFYRYGGRGIKVCEEWHDFLTFKIWADAGYKEDLQLDRINPDGNYEPSNCKWSTRSEQAKNRPGNAERAIFMNRLKLKK